MTSTRDKLPYWIEKRDGYAGQVFLHGVMLGFKKGTWPVQAFAVDADGGCDRAARWAAEDPSNRVLVGPITISDDVPVKVAVQIPARFDLTERKL